MTVCGEKVTGVCVAGKCPHFKRCCPVVWDKYGRIKPQTNEEYMQTCSSDELANTIFRLIVHGTVIRPDREYIKRWLKEKHDEM